MITESIQEDITIVNVYAPNIGAPQYIRQTLTGIRGEIDSNTIIVRDLKTPLSSMDRSSKLRINKETQSLNGTLDQMDLIDIFRTFHPNAEEYTFFSSAHGTFPRIDHILGHKSSLSKFKKIEIVSSNFSDHNTIRLDSSYRKKTATKHKLMEIKPLNNKEVTEEIKKEIKRFLETNDNENTNIQKVWDSAKAVLRGRFIVIQSYLRSKKSIE